MATAQNNEILFPVYISQFNSIQLGGEAGSFHPTMWATEALTEEERHQNQTRLNLSVLGTISNHPAPILFVHIGKLRPREKEKEWLPQGHNKRSWGWWGFWTPAISFSLGALKGQTRKSGLLCGMKGAEGKGPGPLLTQEGEVRLGKCQVDILGSLTYFSTPRRLFPPLGWPQRDLIPAAFKLSPTCWFWTSSRLLKSQTRSWSVPCPSNVLPP